MGQVVLTDEISFMSIGLLAALEHIRLKGVRLIAFGDFGQLPLVSNRWRGCKVPHDTFERSNLFWHWSGGTRFVLRRCRRSDQAHFDFIKSLQDLEPAKALEAAKARYPSRGKRAADWNLTLSNHKRRRINSEMQPEAAVATEDRVWIDGETPFWCFAGTRLIGCNCTLRGIVNGAFLLVTRVSPEAVWLQDEDTSGEELEVSAAQVAKQTRLRWALTLTSVQGRSLPGTVGIHDTSSRHFTAAHLYVALSKATHGANVTICD